MNNIVKDKIKKTICILLVSVLIFVGNASISNVTDGKAGYDMVQAQAAAVRLNRTNCILDIGSTINLKVLGTRKKAKWSTSNRRIATVGGNGLVTAKKAGKCVITAKIGRKKYRCRVSVSSKSLFSYVSRVAYDGVNVYYGVDGYGNKIGGILKYNTKTGKRTRISSLWNWDQLTLKGNFLYIDVADHNGGKFIYKISKDGKIQKKLCRGKTPVIIGNSIYYEGHTTVGPTSFGDITGIYKMDLNGKNKRCLYKNTSGEYISILGQCNGKLVICRKKTEYIMDSKGRMYKANISRKKYNSDFGCPDKEYYNDARMLYISNNTYGYKYFVDESDLIREKNGVEDYIYTFDYKIQSIQNIGDYIFVRTYGINDEYGLGNYDLYLVSKTGYTVKKLAENVGDRGGQ